MRKLLILFQAAWLLPSSFAGVLDDLEQTVVFLKDQVPVTEQVNGESFEVWLKHPKLDIAMRKSFEVTGSGFFVATERVVYLVTARHVATNMSRNCELTVRGENRTSIKVRLSELIGTNNSHVAWIHHSHLDFSVHPIIIEAPRAIDIMRNRALPVALLKTNAAAPSRDVILATLGFPLGMGAEAVFSPFSKESKSGSGFLAEGDFGCFMLQDPSVSGFSGAPLFEPGEPKVIASSPSAFGIVSGGTGCWGLISATLGDVSGGKMAKVVPATYIAQTIRQFEASVTFITPVATNSISNRESPK